MRRTEPAIDQMENMENVNGGMYQGYGGIERLGIMSKGMGPGSNPRGPGMMGPSYYNTPQYVPDPLRLRMVHDLGKNPPRTGMSAGLMSPGDPENNRYQY